MRTKSAPAIIHDDTAMPSAMRSPLFPNRELGVLLHPTSLFGSEDVGTLGRDAVAFVDWLARAGVTRGMVRLSVGLEDPADLLADIDQALAASR